VKFFNYFLVSLLCIFCGTSSSHALPMKEVQVDANFLAAILKVVVLLVLSRARRGGQNVHV